VPVLIFLIWRLRVLGNREHKKIFGEAFQQICMNEGLDETA
jgi:hypothetical protein